MEKIEQLKADLTKALEGARDVAKAAEEADRDFTAEERQKVKAYMDEANDLKKKLEEAKSDADLKSSIDALGDSVDLTPAKGKSQIVVPGKPAGKGNTLGEMFTESAEFKSFMAQFPNGRIPDSAKGIHSSPVEIGGLKALITGDSATSAGAFVSPERTGIFDAGTFMQPLTFRQMVTNGTTQSDSVEYVRLTDFTNAAAPTAEATTAEAVGSGDPAVTSVQAGVKPESALELEKVTATVKTIAHWIPATKRALSDAAQIRTLIDNFLRYGLEDELEDQMINGDGTGENFEGIATVSGTQAQAWDTNLLTTTRKARTKVRTVGRANATAYLLNPADWERIDLLQDAENRYYFGGPSVLGTPRLWGLPVIESESVTAGTGYVGDFRTCVLWDREQASIQVSDSHSDFFVRNMVAILAEMRAAFGVVRPSALVEMDLTA